MAEHGVPDALRAFLVGDEGESKSAEEAVNYGANRRDRRQSVSVNNYILSYIVNESDTAMVISLTDSSTQVMCWQSFTEGELKDAGFPNGDFNLVKRFLDAATKEGNESLSFEVKLSDENEGTHATIELQRKDDLFPWKAVIPLQSNKSNQPKMLHSIIDNLRDENRDLRVQFNTLKLKKKELAQKKAKQFDTSDQAVEELLKRNSLIAQVDRVNRDEKTLTFRVRFSSITHGCKLWVGTIRTQTFPHHLLVLFRCGFDARMLKTKSVSTKVKIVNDWNVDDIYHTAAMDSDGDVRIDRTFEVPLSLGNDEAREFFDRVIAHFVVGVDLFIDKIAGIKGDDDDNQPKGGGADGEDGGLQALLARLAAAAGN